MKNQNITREQWLINLTEALNTELFDNRMPKYRITCGFTSRPSTAIGQCWPPERSDDGTTEIIMTITYAEEMRIADIVAHEMIHAIIGCQEGHNKVFRAEALKIGLTGKMTATVAGEKFIKDVTPIVEKLGKYPHAVLDMTNIKKQTVRNLKAVCDECGYTVRSSRKWLELGAPLCGLHPEPVQMEIV